MTPVGFESEKADLVGSDGCRCFVLMDDCVDELSSCLADFA